MQSHVESGQHDNDPQPSVNAVKAYLDRKTHNGTPTVMDWPPQSPDLNIIGAVGDHLDRQWNKRQPTSKKSFEYLSRSLENYLSRLLEEMTKQLVVKDRFFLSLLI